MIDVLDMHTHTLASGHAYNTIYEMAARGRSLGMEALGITEHAPAMPGTCHEFYFSNLKAVPRVIDGLKMLFGVELNLLDSEGHVDLAEDIIREMDLCVASIHPPCFQEGRSREEVLKEYRKTVEEANKAMETMLPPAGMTPQEQRNYATARKVAMMEVMEERWYGIPVTKTMGWECNECHVLHRDPSECAVKEYGGKWITCTECQVVDEGTPGAQMYTNRIEKKVYKRL